MNQLLSYAWGISNYNIFNKNNVHNFHIIILESLNEDQRRKLIENMIIHIGKSYYESFKLYCFQKLKTNNELLKLF